MDGPSAQLEPNAVTEPVEEPCRSASPGVFVRWVG